jgi:T-complex protein 1 subunit eta
LNLFVIPLRRDDLVFSLSSLFQQPQIILLKEGTENHQGRPQLISNINACEAIVDAIRTTLGPRGMDKLIVGASGKTVISNDGATIMKQLDVVHPAAKTLVDIAKSQDAEVRLVKIP